MKKGLLTKVFLIIALVLITLFVGIANAQKKMPIPVKIADTEEGPLYLTYKDLDQIKLIAIGWLVGAILWLLKTAWDMWQKKNDKSAEQLELITSAVTRLEERFRHFEIRIDHLDKTQPTAHQIHELVRKEIEWFERMKGSGKV